MRLQIWILMPRQIPATFYCVRISLLYTLRVHEICVIKTCSIKVRLVGALKMIQRGKKHNYLFVRRLPSFRIQERQFGKPHEAAAHKGTKNESRENRKKVKKSTANFIYLVSLPELYIRKTRVASFCLFYFARMKYPRNLSNQICHSVYLYIGTCTYHIYINDTTLASEVAKKYF